MQKALIGKKIGMTQIFDEAGKVIPVTVVEAGPCVVIQKKTTENDGYEAVQLGFGDVKVQRVNKPEKGHFDKAGVAPKKSLREFRLDDQSSLNVGDILKADVFAVGDHVDVVGTSKLLQTQDDSRYRPQRKTRRFSRRVQRSLESLQGKEARRSPRPRESYYPES